MFLGAMKFVANRDQLKITPDVYIEGDVGIGHIQQVLVSK